MAPKEKAVMELVGVGSDAGAIILPSIYKTRDGFVATLSKLGPATPNFIVLASEAVSEAKKLLKSVESARKTVKDPVLTLSRAIDAKADEFSSPLQTEVTRIERQVGEAVRKQREAKEAEERLLREEQDRILREEEEKKLALQRKLDAAKSDAAKDRISMQIEQAETDTTMALQVLTPKFESAQAPILTGGSQVRTRWVGTVTDQAKAFAACPEIFEITYSPSRFAAWAKLNSPNGQQPPAIPGVVITKDVKASIR